MIRGRQDAMSLLVLLLSLCGAGIAVYLTTVHYEHVPLLCSASGVVDCLRVTSSSYSVVPGTTIPITIPGLLWALGSAALAGLAWRWRPYHRGVMLLHWLWSLLALLAALYLVYVEIVLLRAICLWCTGLHAIILAVFLLTLARLTSPTGEIDEQEYQAGEER